MLEAWLLHRTAPCICDMTHSYVWHDSFIRVTWLIHMCDCCTAPRPVYVTHMNESCHTYEWVVSHIWMSRAYVSLLHRTAPCICDMTHSYVWHNPLIRVTWLIHMCHCCTAPRPVYVTWLIHMCDTTHSYVWRGSFICVTAAPHCAMYMWHDSFICVTQPTCMCDVAHSYVWHRSILCVWSKWRGSSLYMCQWAMSLWPMSHIWIDPCHTYECDVAHSYETYGTHTYVTHMNEPSSYVWHRARVDESCHHMCDMTHSYVW